MSKKKPKTTRVPDFYIENDTSNGFKLSIRCQEWAITYCDADEVSDADVEMFQRIEEVLNQSAAYILDIDE